MRLRMGGRLGHPENEGAVGSGWWRSGSRPAGARAAMERSAGRGEAGEASPRPPSRNPAMRVAGPRAPPSRDGTAPQSSRPGEAPGVPVSSRSVSVSWGAAVIQVSGAWFRSTFGVSGWRHPIAMTMERKRKATAPKAHPRPQTPVVSREGPNRSNAGWPGVRPGMSPKVVVFPANREKTGRGEAGPGSGHPETTRMTHGTFWFRGFCTNDNGGRGLGPRPPSRYR